MEFHTVFGVDCNPCFWMKDENKKAPSAEEGTKMWLKAFKTSNLDIFFIVNKIEKNQDQHL